MRRRRQLVLIWIFLLTFTGGYTNGSAILYYGTPITHHTGNLSQLALGLLPQVSPRGILMLVIILSFFLGATISGILFSERLKIPSKRYGLLLYAAALVLGICQLIQPSMPLHLGIIAFIQGAQNGMFIHYKGLLVRTTHMTGYLSDAGFYFGSSLCGKKIDRRKSLFYAIGVFVFFLGSLLAVILEPILGRGLFTLTAIFYALCATYYFVMRKNYARNHQA